MRADSGINLAKTAYHKLIQTSDGKLRVISVQQHTLTVVQTVLLNTMSIAGATHGPAKDTFSPKANENNR